MPLLGGAPGQQYRMVGIPNGLGPHPNGERMSTLVMNHELDNTALSEPIVGGPKNRGAFVSQWILDADGDPIAGRRAYDRVFRDDASVGPAPDATNTTRALARFCSGFLARPAIAHGTERIAPVGVRSRVQHEHSARPLPGFGGRREHR